MFCTFILIIISSREGNQLTLETANDLVTRTSES